MLRIAIVGLGAVGYVLSTALLELLAEDDLELLVIVRNAEKAQAFMPRSKEALRHVRVLQIPDLVGLMKDPKKVDRTIGRIDAIINVALPDLNAPLLAYAARRGIHYADLASDMYDDKTLRTQTFAQYAFDDQMRRAHAFGLINAGISPGVTNMLIGERIQALRQHHPDARVRSVDLFLLEDIRARQVVFSWSPQVALDELEQKPRYYVDGKLRSSAPFGHSQQRPFPHHDGESEQYPIFQEEVLSLHRTFPDIGSVRVSTGGSEVELMKSLFQLNLLSRAHRDELADGVTVDRLLRAILPRLKVPAETAALTRRRVIRSAHFAAMAEITIESRGSRPSTMQEIVGLSFHQYRELLGSPYEGATYISYPTGVGAAVLFVATLRAWQQRPKDIRGILTGEELPALLGTDATASMKHALTSFGIDLVSHAHAEVVTPAA